MGVSGYVLGSEVHQHAIALAEMGEAGLVEHSAAVREVHAAVLTGLGGGGARYYESSFVCTAETPLFRICFCKYVLLIASRASIPDTSLP